MSEIVILASARTPFGSFGGPLATIPAPRLGAAAIRAAVERAAVATDRVTDVLMGNVLSAGLGQAPARQAALAAGLSPSTRCVTINKVCGSALYAVQTAACYLQTGLADLAVAGGMESMSSVPFLLPKAREGYRLGHQKALDGLIWDGLWDPYGDAHMGSLAEKCAAQFSFSREEQDAFAAESYRRALAAQASGALAEEIVAVETAGGGGSRVALDDSPAKVSYEKIPKLRPVFDRGGTITAANASSLSDGAAAVVLARADDAARAGWKPQARLAGFGSHAQEPAWFTTAPVGAARKALAAAGWSTADVDVWEVNEAFAVVPLAFARELGVSLERINCHGGAIALGHPIGASGARILIALMTVLRRSGGRKGVAAICIGGGEALAVCVELL